MGWETLYLSRTLRKDTSLEQYAPTPPRKKKGLLSRSGRRQVGMMRIIIFWNIRIYINTFRDNFTQILLSYF